MNMNQKGFVNIILVVVIVVLIGAVGYFAFVKKSEPQTQQPQVNQTPSPTPIPTSWQVYTNTKYSFSISHPKNWYTRENQFANFFRYAFSPQPLKISNDAGGEPGDLKDTFIIFTNPTFEDFIGGRRNSERDTSLNAYLENGSKIQALQYKAIDFNNMSAYLVGMGRTPEIFEIIIEHKGEIYSITLPYGASDFSKLSDTQRQILSTFKFTN